MAFTLKLGSKAPDFKLPGADGKDYSLDTFKGAKLGLVQSRVTLFPSSRFLCES